EHRMHSLFPSFLEATGVEKEQSAVFYAFGFESSGASRTVDMPERAPSQPIADPLTRIRVVLVRTSHPGNIGAAARAMHTMGLSRLTLVAPKHLPDRDAFALASRGAHILQAAQRVTSLDDALAGAALTIGLSARPRQFAGRV